MKVYGRSAGSSPRSFGFRKSGGMMAAIHTFEVQRRSPGEGKNTVVHIRNKRPRRS